MAAPDLALARNFLDSWGGHGYIKLLEVQFSGRVLGDEHKSPPPWIKRLPTKRDGIFMLTVGVIKRWIAGVVGRGRKAGMEWCCALWATTAQGDMWAKRGAEGAGM